MTLTCSPASYPFSELRCCSQAPGAHGQFAGQVGSKLRISWHRPHLAGHRVYTKNSLKALPPWLWGDRGGTFQNDQQSLFFPILQ
jgi:hypothetical protein